MASEGDEVIKIEKIGNFVKGRSGRNMTETGSRMGAWDTETES